MRLAFYLDNLGLTKFSNLPDPLLGNPGIGGTEYSFILAVRLLQQGPVAAHLYLRAPMRIDGIDTGNISCVSSLTQAIYLSPQFLGLVLRPGFAEPSDWPALEHSPVPLLLWLHNLAFSDQARFEQLSTVKRWLLVSGAQLDSYRHSRLSSKSTVLPNCVPPPPLGSAKRTLTSARSATDLAFVGALTPFKGFDRLARNWSFIARSCPSAKLRVFGGSDLYRPTSSIVSLTSYEKYCRDLLDDGGFSDRVIFHGTTGLERFSSFTNVAVGIVNPSGRDETFCLAAAEFSAYGIPVLAPRRNALIQTVRDQKTGLLFDSDLQLVNNAILLLNDPFRAWSLGSEGQSFAYAAYGPQQIRHHWCCLAHELSNDVASQSPPVTTPWWHEHRWLRQLWGYGFVLPGWPSWPVLKSILKSMLQVGGNPLPSRVAYLAGLMAFILWALLVFGKFGGNPTGLARIGERFASNPHLPQEQLLVLPGKRGNDGQQFLVLATDPFQRDPATTRAVDNPVYRGKRLLYPLLAWVTGLGQSRLITWTLGLINVVCIAIAAWLVAQWAELEQRNPRWGLAVLALPGYWITLTLSTADLLATTLLLAAAVVWRKGRLGPLAGALSAALLTRETALLAWASTGVAALWERRWRWLLPLALVPVPLLALMAWLKARFAVIADGLLATLHFGPPGLGILQKAEQLLGLRMLPGPPLLGLERGFDGLCLLFWLATLGVLLVTALRGWGGRWLRITAAIYLLPALCTSTQILARFPDYTRVWIDLGSLALLALISSRSPVLRWWLGGATALSLGYGLGFGWLT